MEKQELRAVSSLAAVFSVRLLGLFMIYPVFAEYARQLAGATPFKIGLALGIYGLSQGLVADPVWSALRPGRPQADDRTGTAAVRGRQRGGGARHRRIDGVILGRVLQGGGAVGSVILALVADLTAEDSRTQAMAMVGMTIGGAFMFALIAGPVLAGLIGVPGIFWIMVGLALVGIAITLFVVPRPRALARAPRCRDGAVAAEIDRGNPRAPASRFRRLRAARHAHRELSAGARLAAVAVCGMDSHHQWIVYLPVLLVSVAVDGARHHRRREISAHEGRVRRGGRGCWP